LVMMQTAPVAAAVSCWSLVMMQTAPVAAAVGCAKPC